MKKINFAFIILFLFSLPLIIFYQPWVNALPPTPRHASPEQLEKTVRYLTQTVHPRSADNIDNLNRSAEYIKEVFISNGARVTAQDVPITGGPNKNIVANYGPADGPLIIIGAHYDSVSSYENDQLTYTPGADDNASGVAGLLELARLLQQQTPGIGVQLVAYASEEPPFFRSDEMGSAVHAASLERPVKLMIALEMIGYYDSTPGLPLPGNVLALSRSGRLYCRGRQNAGYQRRSSGKSGIVVIPGFICLFYECPRFYSRY